MQSRTGIRQAHSCGKFPKNRWRDQHSAIGDRGEVSEYPSRNKVMSGPRIRDHEKISFHAVHDNSKFAGVRGVGGKMLETAGRILSNGPSRLSAFCNRSKCVDISPILDSVVVDCTSEEGVNFHAGGEAEDLGNRSWSGVGCGKRCYGVLK